MVAQILPQEGDDVVSCRFYERRLPEMEELVVVRVKSISETAAYVVLLEYNGIEGMIPLSELSRRRIRSVNKHIRVGKTEIVQVFRVDAEKGYIDLSKRKVASDDIKPAEMRYNKAKDVHSIMMHVARECKVNLESLYQAVAWPLYKKYGHGYDAFSMAVGQPDKVLGPLELPDEIKNKLIYNIEHRHKAQPFRVRADVEVTCFTYEGIDGIREALKKGMEIATEGDIQVQIKLLAAPTYVVVAQSTDKDQGIAAVQRALDAIKSAITAKHGQLKVAKEPRVVSSYEEIKHRDDEEDEEEEDSEDDSDEEDSGEGEE
jgi:translation initiation factor 2 subunit 1